ncbi:6670_t:CDS:10 [Acaulospora morrowiae]|uniref:6670_t:CDS:1 n=1 Tax=Acaulospora morrowiae TaxID=94023 RepID=A0A9N9ADQ4_9GLOM|nr:6670_t:CDS:10 [Acaulospora morrowiae]
MSHTDSRTPPANVEFLTSIEIRLILREAVINCSERGLYFAAKWAAETLDGLPTSDESSEEMKMDISHDSFFQQKQKSTYLDRVEYDKYLLGKSYFDVKEFDRAAFVLEKCRSAKCRFLRIYSKYLAGEKRKEEERQDIMGPLENEKSLNKEIQSLWEEMESWREEEEEMDGFLVYLYGLIMKQKNPQSKGIKDIFLDSVCRYHYNWSAWLELASCITTKDMLEEVVNLLPDTFMTKFFRIYMSVELLGTPQSFRDLVDAEFRERFPNSKFLQTQEALMYYHNRDYAGSEAVFDEIIKTDPYRLEEMDIYSNILYVMEMKFAKLSFLAHMCAFTDKYRSETMCVIGNYYSSKGDRVKAISYFRRALQVNRNCLSAWTLMGHEYVELKNTHAAVISYKRAVEINSRDYRAWCGLGQTYEFLKMPYYALYYLQRSLAIRPYDARMWIRLGALYEQINVTRESIKAYTRALSCTDIDINTEAQATVKLASLYANSSKPDKEKAAELYTKILKRKDFPIEEEDIRAAELFLSGYKQENQEFAGTSDQNMSILNGEKTVST